MFKIEGAVIRRMLATSLVAAGLNATAHEPVAHCMLLAPDTVRCRGATNDGDEMPGARMDVIAHDGRLLLEGRLDSRSTLTFSKPSQPYYVLFEIGPGLQVAIEQEEVAPVPARLAGWMQR